MSFRPNIGARNGVLDEGVSYFDGLTITIYTGSQPGSGGGSTAETVLASGTIPTPAFDAADAGAASVASNWPLSITATGTAGWARITDGAGGVVDLSCGADESGEDLELSTTSLENGGTASVTFGTITLPNNDA